jgi:hypothetical protein
MVVHAFGPRVAVVDPPAHRVTESGLIVISSDVKVATGVVINNPAIERSEKLDEFSEVTQMLGAVQVLNGEDIALKPGVLVYYHQEAGIRIRDLIIVELRAVLAWED